MIQCHACKRIIIDRTNDGGYKLRSRMVLFREDEAYALCPSCKTEVRVPIELSTDIPTADKAPHVISINKLPKSKIMKEKD